MAGNAEVACHNDLSPDNTVYRDGRPIALIDWDNAAPGSRVDDVAYAAWLYLDLGADSVSADQQRPRLRLFGEAYGLPVGTDLAVAIVKRVRRNLRELEEALAERPEHVDLDFVERAVGWNRDQLSWLERNAPTLRG